MWKLILVVVILQLVITLTNQYKFGDIISFKRQCIKRYKHFAVYVASGPKIHEEQVGHDIFQRTGPIVGINPPKLSDCVFDDLKKEEAKKNIEVKVDNYLDGLENVTVGTEAEMAERIREKLHECKVYNPIKNNCEHVATYVRYNITLSLQRGTSLADRFCKANKEICEEIKRKEKEILDGVEAEFECMKKLENKTG